MSIVTSKIYKGVLQMRFMKTRLAIIIAFLLSLISISSVLSAAPFDYKYYEKEAATKQESLSQFTTKFNKNSKARTHNMKLCSMAIDNYVLNPGEVFSFNEVVGYAGPQQGYQKAVIFVDGKEEKAYGGGICQVSSTLYNAAMEAKLEIVERHPHSKPVGYVPEGKDAATSYNGVDLKFKNTHSFPVTINSYISDNSYTVEILK